MPHVSKYKLKENIEETLNNLLNTALIKIDNEDDMRSFLLSLLSPTEKLMLAKRLGIVILLNESLPEARIASALNVTRETVARMRMIYKIQGTGYALIIEKLQKEKLMEDLRNLQTK